MGVLGHLRGINGDPGLPVALRKSLMPIANLVDEVVDKQQSICASSSDRKVSSTPDREQPTVRPTHVLAFLLLRLPDPFLQPWLDAAQVMCNLLEVPGCVGDMSVVLSRRPATLRPRSSHRTHRL